MSDAEAFYCLMVGSRSFSDYEFFVTKCDHLLRNWKNIIIVSGGASVRPKSAWSRNGMK